MNCTDVKDLLSAYFDGELSDELHLQVRRHVGGCSECSKELDGFGRLSQLASGSTVSPPSAELWTRIESGIDSKVLPSSTSRQSTSSRSATYYWSARRWAILAATVLVAVSVGVIGYRSLFSPSEHHQFMTVFGEYLDRFKSDPHNAQSFLLAQYQHHSVQPEAAVERAGYRPVVADGLPEGYSLVSTHVMKMPCCTCVQCLCRRADGTTLAIFEHDDDQPDWFGSRPTVNVTCQSRQCALVELPSSMAASWKSGKRHLTVIGAENVGEVDKLVAWFSQDREGTRL
ncbi:MAG: zf-HC2 domain-containing protein [Planctomycetaceae bacterium]|nr:zf-HC2 domain-containing protein [Planctomycetaceae bacterium]